MKSVCLLCLCVLCVPTLVLAQPHPVPLVNQPLVPTSVAPGGPGFTLTVNGTGFVTGSVVYWNGSALTTHFVSSAQLTAAVPSADVTTAGTAVVTVVSPGPGGGTSNTVFFTVSSPIAAPIFTALPLNPGFPLNSGFPDGRYSAPVADVNGDGKLDLVYLAENSVRVQLGNGDGTFQAPASYAVGGQPFGLVTGDFNGDGNLDLAVANYLDATISVLLGNGDGTFQPQTTFATACSPFNLVAGDFNGDGKMDLVLDVVSSETGQAATYTLSVTPGGGFNQTVSFTCSGAPAQSTCLVSPGAIALNGSASTPVTVTVSTVAVAAAMLQPFTGSRAGGTFGVGFPVVALLGPMLLVSSGWRRDRRRVLMLAIPLALLCCVAVIMSACGGGGSSNGGGGNAGTPQGTYTLTVSGASNAGATVLRHDTQLTLIVQ